MIRPLSTLFVFIAMTLMVTAQNRYFGEVFGTVSVTPDVVYGNNYSVLTGTPVAQDLHMDIYTPDGDTVSVRPVVLVVHDGEMLPFPYNQECIGHKDDEHIVELCTRLAKYGYVVASVDYRLGWNAVSPTQEQRTSSYINALYRGMQDVRNAVRFLRWSAANGNPYAIHADKISVIGEGTGAELAVWVGALDRYEEMDLPKFLDFSTLTLMVDSAQVGNVYGTEERPMNLANYPSFSSDVSFVGSLGGAVGDSTWMEAGEPPLVSMHSLNNPFVPVGFGAVIVATTSEFVVNVSGSRDVQRISNALGNNESYISAMLNDPVTQVANAMNDGNNGFYPFIRPTVECSPWQWWEVSCPNNTQATSTNPDMSESKGQAYIDTIMAYMGPRMAHANGFWNSGVGIEDAVAISFELFPNPTANELYFRTENALPVRTVQLTDLSGRTVMRRNINATAGRLDVSALTSGTYLMQLRVGDMLQTERFVVQR